LAKKYLEFGFVFLTRIFFLGIPVSGLYQQLRIISLGIWEVEKVVVEDLVLTFWRGGTGDWSSARGSYERGPEKWRYATTAKKRGPTKHTYWKLHRKPTQFTIIAIGNVATSQDLTSGSSVLKLLDEKYARQ